MTTSTKLVTLAPISTMSPWDQALHLVYDHGFDADYFGSTPALLALLPDNVAVVRAFLGQIDADTVDAASDGHSIPLLDGFLDVHEDDHTHNEWPNTEFHHLHEENT